MKKSVVVAIRITEEQKEQIEQRAREERRTPSNYLYLVIVDHLAKGKD